MECQNTGPWHLGISEEGGSRTPSSETEYLPANLPLFLFRQLAPMPGGNGSSHPVTHSKRASIIGLPMELRVIVQASRSLLLGFQLLIPLISLNVTTQGSS